MTITKPKLKEYYVTYSVTREELYRFMGTSPDEAENRAFDCGICVDSGETTNVTHIATHIAPERIKLAVNNTTKENVK